MAESLHLGKDTQVPGKEVGRDQEGGWLICFLRFIYFERGGDGQRERIPSRLHAVSIEPDVGLKLMNREIMA